VLPHVTLAAGWEKYRSDALEESLRNLLWKKLLVAQRDPLLSQYPGQENSQRKAAIANAKFRLSDDILKQHCRVLVLVLLT
jgi:hypothetical protein